MEEFEVTKDVGLDFLRLGFGVDRLEFGDDLLDGVAAVAALNDLEAGAVEAKGAFGHQQNALLVVFAEADARCEEGFAVGIKSHVGTFGLALTFETSSRVALLPGGELRRISVANP